MNTDIRIDIRLPRHRKYKRLKRLLSVSPMEYLVCLWCTVAEEMPDGQLVGWSPQDVEAAADWDGSAGELCTALVEVGFLDITADGFYPHDWVEHQPWAVEANIRSDQGRFSRLAQVAPPVHRELLKAGVTAISKKRYHEVVTNYRGTLGVTPGVPQAPPEGTPGVTPAPAPSPLPALKPITTNRATTVFQGGAKSLYACGKVDNLPQNIDKALLDAQSRLVDKRQEIEKQIGWEGEKAGSA